MRVEPTTMIKSSTLRLSEDLWLSLKNHAQEKEVSVNRLIHSILTTSLGKKEVLFDEVAGKLEKKDIESRVYFTVGEGAVLKAYAASNGWSLSQEIRYRVVSSVAKKPKLSGEELKAIYAVRSSINVLGANINRLVRDHKPLSDSNIHICQDLMTLLQELKDKISYLESCCSSTFKLKASGE